ncbi:MAG: hypothetical protein KBD47_01460 [Candidatus Pacebacteria bacterium]|nr:hypothetical protein [Candidatus Paceibacterota bacterium]
MFKIIWLIALVCSIALMINRRGKVQKGQTSQEGLIRSEKGMVWVLSLLNPILCGAILYYGWKNILPNKAKKANQISLLAFFIWILIFVAGFIYFGSTEA